MLLPSGFEEEMRWHTEQEYGSPKATAREDILQAMKRVLKSCCCSRVALEDGVVVVVVDDVDVGEERSWCNVNTILHSGSAANHGL